MAETSPHTTQTLLLRYAQLSNYRWADRAPKSRSFLASRTCSVSSCFVRCYQPDMGAHAYWYTVDYQEDITLALNVLRTREFMAGRYNPVIPFLNFPIDPDSPMPGAAHTSIDEAMEAAEEDGTRSILDIGAISDEPAFCTSCKLSNQELESLFGTVFPTVDQIQNCDAFWDSLERGKARHIVVHEAGVPRLIFFAGYSFD